MTAKSIIEVNVQDGAFNAFQEKFKQYQAALAKMPAAWRDIGKAEEESIKVVEKTKKETEKTVDGAKKESEKRAKETTQKERQAAKEIKESAKETEKIEKERAKRWKDMRKSSIDFAKNITGATASMTKWLGFTASFGLLGAGGGFFGMDKLARSVSNDRRSAQGFGITSGEQKAFNINYGQHVDADSMLSNIANAKSDYSKRWAFGAMGIQQSAINSKDPAELAADIIKQAKEILKRGDGSEQYAKSHGLLEFMSMEDTRRIGALAQCLTTS